MSVAALLPKDAREALVAASRVPDPQERERAINEATERAKRKYPQYFKQPAKEHEHA